MNFCDKHVNLASTVIALMINIKGLLCLYSFHYSHDKVTFCTFLCFLVSHKPLINIDTCRVDVACLHSPSSNGLLYL